MLLLHKVFKRALQPFTFSEIADIKSADSENSTSKVGIICLLPALTTQHPGINQTKNLTSQATTVGGCGSGGTASHFPIGMVSGSISDSSSLVPKCS